MLSETHAHKAKALTFLDRNFNDYHNLYHLMCTITNKYKQDTSHTSSFTKTP